jgi:hypothetical protein
MRAPPSSPPPPTTVAAAAPPPPVDRRLQVLLPVASDIQLDASFFERTPADVKAEYARLAARRRAGEVLTTRAHKERQAAAAARGAAAALKEAAVRVRFPEVTWRLALQLGFGRNNHSGPARLV